MFKKLLAALILVVFMSQVAFAIELAPKAQVIDDFEDYYVDTTVPIFSNYWSSYNSDTPGESLSTTVSNAGDQSMKLDYSYDAFGTAWAVRDITVGSFEGQIDFENIAAISLYAQGFESNSDDNVSIVLLDDEGTQIFGSSAIGAADKPGWTRHQFDLSGDLADVTMIAVGVEDGDGTAGSGIIYIDDISITSDTYNVWQGNTTEWTAASNWSHGVPTERMDAKIPETPSGGMMPTVTAAGATAHDLVIESGATVSLATNIDLSLRGTLINNGAMVSHKFVGTSQIVDFLTDSGHPGLTIDTNSPSTASFAPDAADEHINTTVTIDAQSTCSTTGNSVRRCYDISPASELTSTITFYFSEQDLNEKDCATLSLYHKQEGTWVKIAGPEFSETTTYQCEVANYSMTVQGVSSYSPFLVSVDAPTAVNLQTFSAAAQPQTVLLIAGGLLAFFSLLALVLARHRADGR